MSIRFSLFSLMLALSGSFIPHHGILAQPYTVTVSIAVTPPYTSRIDDYISQPNKIMATLINTSPDPVDVFLRGEVSGEGGIRVYTDPNFKPAESITLNPGIPFLINLDNLQQVFDANHLVFVGTTKEKILYQNGLPEGDYTICLRVFDFNTSHPLSAEEPLGCSNVFTVTNVEPPVILQPVCGEVITPATPQHIIFSWTRPPGCPVNVQFNFKMIEVLPYDRNLNDAMKSATHPVFFETTSLVNTYLYSPGDPALVINKRYAFAVTAIDPSGKPFSSNEE